MSERIPIPLGGASFTLVEHDGRPWWLAHEVCRHLGIKDVGQAIRQGRLEEGSDFIRLAGEARSRFQNDQRLAIGLRRIFLLTHLGLLGLLQNSRKPEARRLRERLFTLLAARGGNQVRLGRPTGRPFRPDWKGILKLFELAGAGEALAVERLRQMGFTPEGDIPSEFRVDPGPGVVARLIALARPGNRYAGNVLARGLGLPLPPELQLALPGVEA